MSKSLKDQVYIQVHNHVRDQVYNQVLNQVCNQVWGLLSPSRQILDHVEFQVWETVDLAIDINNPE